MVNRRVRITVAIRSLVPVALFFSVVLSAVGVSIAATLHATVACIAAVVALAAAVGGLVVYVLRADTAAEQSERWGGPLPKFDAWWRDFERDIWAQINATPRGDVPRRQD